MKEIEDEINNLITNRYDYLEGVASNILFKYFYPQSKSSEIISELYLYMMNNKEKLISYIERETLEGFCVTWIQTQIRYPNSPFNRKNAIHEGEFVEDVINDIVSEELYDNEYENDLASYLTESQIEDIRSINNILHHLSQSEKILYDLYFVKMMTLREIAAYSSIKISYMTIYGMVKKLKEKIKLLLNE